MGKRFGSEVNGLFLNPFPWVKDEREVFKLLYITKNTSMWYDVEVTEDGEINE